VGVRNGAKRASSPPLINTQCVRSVASTPFQTVLYTGFLEVPTLNGYGIPGSETDDRTASSMISTASSLLKLLPRLSERQVWKSIAKTV